MRPLYLTSRKSLLFLCLLLLSSFWFYAFVSFQDYSVNDSQAQKGFGRFPSLWSRLRHKNLQQMSVPLVYRWNSSDDNNSNSTYSSPPSVLSSRSQYNDSKSGRHQMPKILLWTPFFGQWEIPQGQSETGVLENCSKTCIVTKDRSLMDQSVVVVFHVRDMDMADLPSRRSATQRWVFWNMESPIYSEFNGFRYMWNMFNWTMSYRQDSDIVINYGHIVPVSQRNPVDFEKIYKTKQRTVVWMVSHCSTASEREDYVRELQKHIDVDVYGRCGTFRCPMDQTKSCLKDFEKRYMFILALENAVCRDYATEKLFTALQHDIVPVVLGGANYSKITPPNSFIDALSFSSPKDLAAFLLTVSKDFELYKSYLEWKTDFQIARWVETFCGMCEKIHASKPQEHSVYSDMGRWWIREAKCRSWKQR